MKKFSLTRLSVIAFAVLSMIAVSCNEDNNDGNPPAQSITDIVVADPNFSTLKAAVLKAGLADALATTNPLTVFAPDNAAFNASGITEATIASLPVSAVDSILKYHVLGAFVTSTSVPVSDAVNPLLGIKLFASRNANGVFMNGIKVKQADIPASNGVIHVIDRVLIPPTKTIAQIAAADTSFSFLVAAVTRVGLLSAISGPGKFTVFAPTNAAFRAAGITDIAAVPLATLTAVVQAHVLTTNVFASDLINNTTVQTLQTGNLRITTPPAGVKIDGSTQPVSLINVANITATNGVIHVLSRAMLP
ncbi:MAG: fasciclin domain-containing protein [Chitinophagaceae bacterium]